jgi:hypothetical protein
MFDSEPIMMGVGAEVIEVPASQSRLGGNGAPEAGTDSQSR